MIHDRTTAAAAAEMMAGPDMSHWDRWFAGPWNRWAELELRTLPDCANEKAGY